MTILTKPLTGEKKGDKLITPLVDNDQLATAPPADDVEGQRGPSVVILRARARRVSASTTLCLLLASLVVVNVGIFGGKYLYDQYISAQMRRFHGYAHIPLRSDDFYQNQPLMANSDIFRILPNEYDDNNNNNNNNNNDDDSENAINSKRNGDNFDEIIRDYFREEFEIDMEKGDYEKIDVPDFRDGRSGRFIHDFNTNITGIIDITGNRCFVMPLNRGNVLPPKSLFDLIHKMWEGYYKVDTQIVRETMRVITPPLKDLKGIGTYIAKECEGKPVYQLEKFVGGVVKRSADLHVEAKFAQFSGNKITEFDIINLDEVKAYEEKNNIH